LAVVAGYSLLFAVSRGFVESERLDRHQQLVISLADGLGDGRVTLPLPPGLGVEARWSNSALLDPAQTIRAVDGRVWLISRTPLDAPSQQASVLEVRQDITASVARSQRDLLLLIAVAGGSVLFTSALLRLVIWRGLIQSLRGFTHELEQLEADSLGSHVLSTAEHPSEFRSIVEAFNQLQARLASAWQRERRFVDGVAHELRTPITVISSHAQRLQAEPSQNSPAAVALIAAEAKRLGQLISVMLDFARVDAGRLALAVMDHDPEALLLEAFERLQGLALERLQLAPSFEGDLPRIRADADRVHQCLAVLVDNALRYSEGFVQLGLSASHNGVTLHVRDQGPGISVAERDQVLERFVRGSTASGTQGSGLGLAIVHDLMRAMQGELLIRDVPGGGADLQLRFRTSARPPAP
jgi:signal transduction histidine kinase